MNGYSDYLSNKLLDHWLGVAAYTPPDIYVGLSTTAPAADGTNITEPTGTWYDRVQVAAWDAAVAGLSDNTGVIDFGTSDANENDITHVVLFDAASGGNMLVSSPLASPQSISIGNPVSVPAGNCDVTLTHQ